MELPSSCRRENAALVVSFPQDQTLHQALLPPAPRAGSLFLARGHCLAEQLWEQGVGTALRRCEHMQISQRDAYPKVLMNL